MLVQSLNADSPMLVTLLPKVMLAKSEQLWNTEFPMVMTLSGMITLVRSEQLKNEESPIIATVREANVSGMVTTPPGPIYPVIVHVPSPLSDQV